MKTDDDIRNDLESINERTINVVSDLLREYNKEMRMYLAEIVANLCDVDCDDMLADTKHLFNVQSRWLYWYAYRYMTNDSFSSIANTHTKRKFGTSCVCASVSKMSMMISQNTIWTKRWMILKHFIKIILNEKGIEQDLFPTTITLRYSAPKGLNVELKKE